MAIRPSPLTRSDPGVRFLSIVTHGSVNGNGTATSARNSAAVTSLSTAAARAPAARPARTVDALLGVLRRGERVESGRDDPDDDVISMLEHGLQCAGLLAHVDPTDVELQIAGLVHDVGHLVAPGDPANHGRHGASFVRTLLGPRVADLVELHVTAKRYLATVDGRYKSSLALPSFRTLVTQGGQLLPTELETFRGHPEHSRAILLRRADDAAKVDGLDSGTLDEWRPVLEALAHAYRR